MKIDSKYYFLHPSEIRYFYVDGQSFIVKFKKFNIHKYLNKFIDDEKEFLVIIIKIFTQFFYQ